MLLWITDLDEKVIIRKMYSRQIIEQSIRSVPSENLIYLNNPKAGCSSVKMSLWRILNNCNSEGVRDVHAIDGSPFVNQIQDVGGIFSARVFTFVRNPFSRAVSAYMNKISDRKSVNWGWFAKRYSVREDMDISFDDFIEIIHADSPELLDPHWRPQYINVLYPLSEPNFIGHVETIDQQLPEVLAAYLPGRGGQAVSHRPHKTNASETYREFLQNPATRRRVIELYYEDFQYFSYSLDISGPSVPLQITGFTDQAHEALGGLQSFYSAPDRNAGLQFLEQIGEKEGVYAAYPHVLSWKLSQTLAAVASRPGEVRRLLHENLAHIKAGPEFLRRESASLAARHGFWPLCRQLAGIG